MTMMHAVLVETPGEAADRIGDMGSFALLRMTSVGNYFCATSSLARLNSGRVEFDPSHTFKSRA
jgi:hypothetical protein